jgi:hypothetical protein
MIKEGKEAAAKMKADDPKVKGATAKLDEAQKLHGEGKHADSVKAAEEAQRHARHQALGNLGQGEQKLPLPTVSALLSRKSCLPTAIPSERSRTSGRPRGRPASSSR